MTFTRFGGTFARTTAGLRASTWRIAAACAFGVLSFAAMAADDDLPGRVGRVSDAAGALFLSPDDQAAQWTEIGVNYPITSGDNLWASDGGRAEIDYGGGQFRLAGATNIQVSRLDDRQLVLFVAQGRLIVRIRALDPGEAVRVDAPTAQVQLTRLGLYRIDVLPERQTTVVTIREGEALIALPSGVWQALAGQAVTITGQDPAVAERHGASGVDGYDTWSADRDRYYERSGASAYVSGQMVGTADLDQYGAWQTYPDYGAVWFPNAVAPDWAPYRDGYWTSVGAWGPTWVDAAPWGYAPFHYGRWAWIGGRWGWCPGSYVPRPVWAPALVAWHGGAGWAVSASFGAPVYGWVPLGWREPYLPSWRGCSTRCWTRYNQPYAVDVRERPPRPPASYVNMAVPGALTAVSGATLTGARPIAVNRLRLPPQAGGAAPVLAGAPPVVAVRTRTPAGSTASLPQPAALVHPQRSRAMNAETNAGAASPSGQPPARGAAAAGGRAAAGSYTMDAAPTPTPQRQPPPARVAAPPAPTVEGSRRVVDAPAARQGSQYGQQRTAPASTAQPAAGATVQAPAQQGFGAMAQPARPVPPQRLERSVAVPVPPAATVAPQQRVDRGMAVPPAAVHPVAPATVVAPVPPQGAAPGGGAPQANQVHPPGRGAADLAPLTPK